MSEFQPIVSSNLDSAAFEDDAIIVRFQNGSQGKYINVTEKIWNDFQKQFDGKQGRSAGKFLNSTLRQMQYERIDDWK